MTAILIRKWLGLASPVMTTRGNKDNHHPSAATRASKLDKRIARRNAIKLNEHPWISIR